MPAVSLEKRRRIHLGSCQNVAFDLDLQVSSSGCAYPTLSIPPSLSAPVAAQSEDTRPSLQACRTCPASPAAQAGQNIRKKSSDSRNECKTPRTPLFSAVMQSIRSTLSTSRKASSATPIISEPSSLSPYRAASSQPSPSLQVPEANQLVASRRPSVPSASTLRPPLSPNHPNLSDIRCCT